MRVSEAGLALIRRIGADGSAEYLTQWSDRWGRFSLVGGHVEPGESFRECCVREVAEELELVAGVGFRVASEAVAPVCEYRAMSGSAGVETLYRVQLFATDLLTPEADAKVNADPANRWLTEPEIRRLATAADRKPVAAQVQTVFVASGVIPKDEEYDLFVSYAHADDASDDGDGFVTALVAALQAEHAPFAPEPLRVFFDRVAIRTADEWRERLYHGVKAAKAMIAVLSPAYFASKWCRWEWEAFVEHEKGRVWPGAPLSPVYAVDVPGFDGPDADARKAWLADVLKYQCCDLKGWRPHGRNAFRVDAVKKLMEALHERVQERIDAARVVSRSTAHGVPPHNRNFVGREKDLAEVRARLAGGAVTAVTAVSGIGGIGKSALAAEYAHLYAKDYPGGRFWLPSEGADDLRDLFRLLESQLGLEFTDDERKDRDRGYRRIRAELERRTGSLVVLDNVSKVALFDPAHLSAYRPDGHRVHMLMTTREEPPTDPEGWLVSVPLDRLSADDGRALLARYRDLGTDDDEWHAAREIVAALGGHALSLEVVGVFVWQRNRTEPAFGYVQYFEWMRQKGLLAAMDRTAKGEGVRLSRHTEKMLGQLLKPTLDALTPAEMRAAEYAALMPADWVVYPWIQQLITADLPAAMTREEIIDPDPWLSLRARLKALRLLVPGNAPELAKMHRVVQAVILGRITEADQEQRRERLEAFSLDRGRYLKAEWYKAEARWEIESLKQFCEHLLVQNRLQGGNLVSWIGPQVRQLGRLSDARQLYRRAIEIGEKHLPPDHPNLADCYSNLGNVEADLGNISEARRLYKRAIEIGEKHFDPGHPELAAWYINLGNVERDLGNFAEARRLFKQAIEIGEKHYHSDHPDLAAYYSSLGNVERDLGNLEEAGRLHRRAIGIEEKHFDPDHPNLAIRYSNLGNVERDLGNLTEARRLFRRAIEIGEKRFDSDHPILAIRYWNLAMLEEQEGVTPAVIERIRKSHRIWFEKFGADHANTKMAREWLIDNDPEFDHERVSRAAATYSPLQRTPMPDVRQPEFIGSAAKLPEDIKKVLGSELLTVFRKLMPKRTVEAITVSRSFSGYSADYWKRLVLGVEVRFADGFETHIVKLGEAKEIRPDFTGWDACTRGRQVASRIFAPVRPVELPKGRYAVLYQDAYTLYGRASEDDRPRSLEDVAGWAVNDAKPDPLSVERAMAHIYTDLARWFYEPVADRTAAVAFYRKRLGVGEEEAGKRALERWEMDDRSALRRDAVWVLCGRDKPDAEAGSARYLDPVEFVAWALADSDPEWPPETLVGPAHGDLHARNVLLGVCRGEAEYPAVFDYGAMGTQNVLAWDFAKLEGELTRVLLPPLLENAAVLEELAGKSKLRPVAPKEPEPGGPTEAAERADRLRAFLRFQELLHDLTARVQTESAAESIRPLAHPPTGLVAVDRLLAILLRVRKEAALCLGFSRPSRQGRWRDEYFFALGVQGLLNAKSNWDYSPHQQECALVASGVALAKSPKAAELLQAAAEAGLAAKEPFPSYRVPLAVIYRLWSDKKHKDAADFAGRVAVGLSEPKPGKGSEPVVHKAARHAVPLQTAAVLAHMEVGRGGPFEHLLNERVRKQAREFGDFETLARLGRLLKDAGDQKWAFTKIAFEYLRDDPAWQFYKNAQEVYAEAYKATDDYYVGINAATLAFLTHNTKDACELSGKVAEACERLHNADLKDRYWVFATEGEAALVRGRPLAGKIPDAAHFYAAALAVLTPGQGAWADSSYRQLCRLWLALGEERVGPLLRLFEAHEIAAPALTRGFMGRLSAP